MQDLVNKVERADKELLARLARDPAPECRLQALRLIIIRWRGDQKVDRGELVSLGVAVISGLDVFSKMEFAAFLARGRTAPRSIAAALATGDRAIAERLRNLALLDDENPGPALGLNLHASPTAMASLDRRGLSSLSRLERSAAPARDVHPGVPAALAPSAPHVVARPAVPPVANPAARRPLLDELLPAAGSPSTGSTTRTVAALDAQPLTAIASSDGTSEKTSLERAHAALAPRPAFEPWPLQAEPEERPVPQLQVVSQAEPAHASGLDLIDLVLDGSLAELAERLCVRSGRPLATVAECLVLGDARVLGELVRDAGCGPALLASLVAAYTRRDMQAANMVAAMRAWELREPERPQLRSVAR